MPEPPHGLRCCYLCIFPRTGGRASSRRWRCFLRYVSGIAAGLLLILAVSTAGWGQHDSGSELAIRQYRSTHFQLWTDLPDAEAEHCLRRMERVLNLAEGYWQRTMQGQVHCYIVKELERWPPDRFPDPRAPQVLRQVRGGTNMAPAEGGRSRSAHAVIYAMAEPRVVEHEVVHAYCFQTFGRGGPAWYREGMAELLSQEADRATTGRISEETIQRLRDIPSPTVHRVTRSGELKESVAAILAASPGADAGTSQPAIIADRLARARTAYAESWALCHVLYHNRNYKQRFQMLGRHLLAGSPVRLDQAFAGRLSEIDFELAFFTERLAAGYRAELCEWDWDRPRRELDVDQSVTVRLNACRGFQPTSIRLSPNQRYRIIAKGTWHVDADGGPVDADGNSDGAGRLEAVVLEQFRLSEPLLLNKDTILATTSSGDLFLRCRDSWGQLGDNRGTIVVRLTRQQ